MKVVYGLGALPKKKPLPAVVTVGVFDGVHRGHRLILKKVVAEAQRRHLKSIVVTFSSHPSEAFPKGRKIPRLTTTEHKLRYLKGEGIDFCYVFPFNKRLASLPAESFVRNILIRRLGMVSFYAGEDFVFGSRRGGDKQFLKGISRVLHFRFHVVRHLKVNNRIVSSTRIRRLIANGRLQGARRMLGRYVSCLGHVIPGEARGKSLGFPTANILSAHEVLAPDGIYATLAVLHGRCFKSVTYLGSRPTFPAWKSGRSFEVYLFDFKKDIYGKTLEIFFIQKIRGDKKFASVEALIARIKKDIAASRRLLKSF